MKNDSTILKKSGILTGVLFTGAILAFPAIGSEASDIYNYSNLGSGSELRSELLDLNNSSSDLATRAISFEKYVEGKCGEGKCGEGKCGEKKDSKESKKDTATTSKTSEGKCGEGKCGEGKCGEKKDSKKTETKSEKK